MGIYCSLGTQMPIAQLSGEQLRVRNPTKKTSKRASQGGTLSLTVSKEATVTDADICVILIPPNCYAAWHCRVVSFGARCLCEPAGVGTPVFTHVSTHVCTCWCVYMCVLVCAGVYVCVWHRCMASFTPSLSSSSWWGKDVMWAPRTNKPKLCLFFSFC